MNAAQKKLKSRSGATILMALLFFLVAAMVSAVIISAATTATKTVKTRRDNQQAYLTCSSAAEYLRDLLLGKEGYKVVFKHNRTVDSDGNVHIANEMKVQTEQAARETSDPAIAVDKLFEEIMSGPDSANLIQNVTPAPVDLKIEVEDLAPVQVKMNLEKASIQAGDNRYCLTAECELKDESPVKVRMELRMYCNIDISDVPISETVATSTYNRRITYQVKWQKDNAIILRDGMEVAQ